MAIVNDFIHLLDSYYKCCRNSLIKPLNYKPHTTVRQYAVSRETSILSGKYRYPVNFRRA